MRRFVRRVPNPLRRAASRALSKEAMAELIRHLKELRMQGRILVDDTLAAPRWTKDSFGLPRRLLKFGFNAILESLPVGAARKRWWHRNGDCGRCGAYQTVHHVMANCKSLLEAGYYTMRHNAVLRLLLDFLLAHVGEEWTVMVDLPDLPSSYRRLPNSWTLSEQRPDLVIYRDNLIILIELTVPADIGCAAAKLRKEVRYDSLVSEISKPDRPCNLVTVEVGALGSFPVNLLRPFTDLCPKASKADINALLLALSIAALSASEEIYRHRDA